MQLPNINKKRIISLLKEGKRFDSREPFQFRDIHLETGISVNAEGSARVRVGKTEVIVGIKMDTQEPYPDHDDEGTMIVSMEFPQIAGERYESGPPQMDSIEIARVIDRGIRESGFIDWKKLCIKEGEKVWSISIDIYCINDDGNVLDASGIAAVAALRMARFPVYDKKEEKVNYGESTDEALPLTEHIPFSMTFYKIGDKFVLDPNRDEEDACEARITMAVSEAKKEKIINSMQKGGIIPISTEALCDAVEKSENIYDEIFHNIDKKTKTLMK